MDEKILTIFLAALLSVSDLVSGWSASYRGAVVEYHPVTGSNDEDTMTKNAANFVTYMKEAKRKVRVLNIKDCEGAEIIVFPEGGLFSNISSPIPDPLDKISPCSDSFQTTKAVKDLSCASKSNKIYSVVNLLEKRKCEPGDKDCPSKNYYLFNTNVAFDRDGVVVARYAKYNLFSLDTVDQPAEPEMGFFDTDFFVRFGMFTCFDILFPTPAQKLVQQYHIKDFLFPTYWFSELPFLSASQMQRGWAETNNVNLLASGINVPSSGSTGSGIFNGKHGHLAQIMTEEATSKLLVADIPKFVPHLTLEPNESPLSSFHKDWHNLTYFSNSFSGNNQPVEKSLLVDESLRRSTTEIIKPEEKFERKICTPTNFCCDFKVTVDSLLPESKNYTYRATAFSGVRPFGAKFRGGAQFCAITVCTGPKPEDCGNRAKGISGLFKFKEINIVGNFKRKNSFQMPSTLIEGKELIPLSANKYEFTKTEEDGNMKVSLQLLWPTIDLHTFAIWGRDFTRDNEALVPESSAPVATLTPVLFAAFISFFLFVP